MLRYADSKWLRLKETVFFFWGGEREEETLWVHKGSKITSGNSPSSVRTRDRLRVQRTKKKRGKKKENRLENDYGTRATDDRRKMVQIIHKGSQKKQQPRLRKKLCQLWYRKLETRDDKYAKELHWGRW